MRPQVAGQTMVRQQTLGNAELMEQRWAWRLLVPRRIPMARYTLLVSWAAMLSSVMMGLSTGWNVDNISGEVGGALMLTSVGLTAGLVALWLLSRLIPAHLYSSSSLLRASAATYVPSLGAGAFGALFALYSREVLLAPETALPLWMAGAFTVVAAMNFTGFAWVVNHLQEREDRISVYMTRLEERLADLQTVHRQVVMAQEVVRREVAEQIHGLVQSRLLVAAHWLVQAQENAKTGRGNSAELIARAQSLIEDTNENEIRPLARKLHPSTVRLGLISAIRSLLTSLSVEGDVEIKKDGYDPSNEKWWQTGLPEELRLTIYRVVEEACNNVLKHSQATGVWVTLERPTADLIRVSVQDNGSGFDPCSMKPGLGVLTMENSCSALDGDLRVTSAPGAGTTVVASFRPSLLAEGDPSSSGVEPRGATLRH